MDSFVKWLGTFLLAFIGGSLGGAALQYASHNRDLDIKMVEIGLDILRLDPKQASVNPAREWAIQVVEAYSGQRFNAEDRKALINNGIRSVSSSDSKSVLGRLVDTELAASCDALPGLNPSEDPAKLVGKLYVSLGACKGKHEGLVSIMRKVLADLEGRNLSQPDVR